MLSLGVVTFSRSGATTERIWRSDPARLWRGTPRTLRLLPNGRVLHERTVRRSGRVNAAGELSRRISRSSARLRLPTIQTIAECGWQRTSAD